MSSSNDVINGVPDGWREFVEECAQAHGGMVNGNTLSVKAALLLAAAPAQPAAQDDDLLLELEGLRESLETARHNWRAFEDRCGDLQVENGKLRDRIAAAQGEGEVQGRERWTVVCGHWQDTTLAIHGERTGHIASGIDEDAAHAIVNAHNQGLLNDALVAARPLLEQNTNKEVTPDGK